MRLSPLASLIKKEFGMEILSSWQLSLKVINSCCFMSGQYCWFLRHVRSKVLKSRLTGLLTFNAEVGQKTRKAWCCLSWFYIFLRSEEWVYFLNVKIGSWCKTSFLFRSLNANCKTWTPGPLMSLNTLDQKWPLNTGGVIPLLCPAWSCFWRHSNKICVTYFLSTKKNYITFGSKYQNLLSIEKQGMLFVWVLNFLCLLVFESMKNPLRLWWKTLSDVHPIQTLLTFPPF